MTGSKTSTYSTASASGMAEGRERDPTAARPEPIATIGRERDPTAARPEPIATIGSAGHDEGKCRPCLWFATSKGCLKGANCINCHFAHFKRPQPSKAKRDAVKRRLARMDAIEAAQSTHGATPSSADIATVLSSSDALPAESEVAVVPRASGRKSKTLISL
eukprot:gnl/TRDRNA2_/TRDRNA2_86326_c0_seq1.p1 gnl/TRDRNA2_/TRDRNA2_86326_c0~~gnl/TRDRNA2_/TRDRNA2_86326_c0_seq1.p1  ORF type:complete len:176 (-),score=10.77 gnl/TRDRNA2_/TRDRNA2_86326_c0_seq1:236-721(-)